MRAFCTLLFFAVFFPLPWLHGVNAATERVLYSFCQQKNCADGAGTAASLVKVNDSLYGTTVSGGIGACYYFGLNGCGTVFSLDPETGSETVIHLFGKGADGMNPIADLIAVKGTLYGTTYGGGAYLGGTVFSLDPKAGDENVLHSFNRAGRDGYWPYASLVDVRGQLYGTTCCGGVYGLGTVFSVDPDTDVETVRHPFGDGADGNSPGWGFLGHLRGKTYGVTSAGGSYGQGAVISLDGISESSGIETVLHSFDVARTDGYQPYGGLIEANHVLYGTTSKGGRHGSGKIFSLDPNTGAEIVVYSFCRQENCSDGATPMAGLAELNGVLYGTTCCGGKFGAGAVYSMDPKTGAESVIHSFRDDNKDGVDPLSSLISIKGTLYGTTYYGGTHDSGTVFSVMP